MGWSQFDAAGAEILDTGSSSGTNVSQPEIRLTTQTGVPVSTTNRTAQATIYATPSSSTGSPLNTAFLRTYTGSAVRQQSFTGDKSLSLAIVAGAVQDVFIKDSDLSLVAEYWKNSTVTVTIAASAVVTWTSHGLSTGDGFVFSTTGALPTGLTAGTTYYVSAIDANTFFVFDTSGNPVTTSGSQSGTHTGYCVGVATGNTTQPRTAALATPSGTDLVCSGSNNTYLWLGTVKASGTNTVEDSVANRYVWNAWNQVLRSLFVQDLVNLTWTYSTDGYRQADANVLNQMGTVCGGSSALWITVTVGASTDGTTGAGGAVAIGIDSIAVPMNLCTRGMLANLGANGSLRLTLTASLSTLNALGSHLYMWLETGTGTATTSWVGTRVTGTLDFNSGLSGWVSA